MKNKLMGEEKAPGLQEAAETFETDDFAIAEVPPTRIIAIGASAGGLEPLEQFFAAMPTPNGMAFVVVQHLSPDFKSLMDELLLRHTKMIILQAVEGMAAEADTIYLMPPRKSMTIKNGILHLEDAREQGRLLLPIDKFLTSLAEDQGERAVAVILSGTGSDGSIGAKAIEKAGGKVIVQEPVTCKFDGMPRNAMAACDQSVIAAPHEMAGYLIAKRTQDETSDSGGQDLSRSSPKIRILETLRQFYKTEFENYKTSTIIRRIERRAHLLKTHDLKTYADIVEKDEEERDLLFSDLLIGVTAFFRDPEAFRHVEELALPRLLEQMSDNRPIRVWVPGCATGEEAYTLAMLLHHRCLAAEKRPNIKIFATDLHQKSLDFASVGRFRSEAVANVPAEYTNRYMEKLGSQYQVTGEIRRLVVFSRQDLLEDPPFTRIDLLSCRNVLIYFNEMAQRRTLSLFHFSLRRDGIMMLGPSETLGGLQDEFDVIDSRWRLFRKLRDIRLHESNQLTRPMPESIGIQPSSMDHQGMSRGVGQRYLIPAYEMLLARHAPPSLLIDRKGDLAHVFGNAKDYLRVHEGVFTQRLLDHIHPDLKAPLSGIIERAWRQTTPVSARCPMNQDGHDSSRVSVEITAEPMTNSTDRSSFLLLTFDAIELPVAKPESTAPEIVESELVDGSQIETLQLRIQTLERDLMFTEESLQSVIEELETSNEELQATNEELMASNEELQSTNEELHSVNEELYTVSAEHQQKIDELTQLSADMDNLLRSTDIGTVFVDQKLHIRRYTPAIARFFNLMEHDIGRPIEHVTFRFKDEYLHRDIREVLNKSEPIAREVALNEEQVYFMRILPYIDGTHRCAGVVLTFVDVSAVKQAEASNKALEIKLAEQNRIEAERSRDQLFALLDGAPLQISVHEGTNHNTVLANRLFKESFGVTDDVLGEALEKTFPTLCAEGGKERFDQVLASGAASPVKELRVRKRGGEKLDLHLAQILQPYVDRQGQRIGVIHYAFDVTAVSLARKEAERLSNALQEQRERLELAFSAGRMGNCSIYLKQGTVLLSSNAADILGVRQQSEPLALEEFEKILTPVSAKRLLSSISAPAIIDIELELNEDRQHPRWLRLFGRPSGRDNAEMTVIMADITSIKSAEQMLSARAHALEAANAQLEQFVSIASHDLKSPLRGIHNLAQFIRDDLATGKDPHIDHHVDRIAEQVQKMSQMLDDLLEYANPETNEPLIERVDMAKLVEDAVSIVSPPNDFVIDHKDSLPILMTSKGALSLVLRNLIANAVHHHDRNNGHVQVSAERVDHALWKISVTDDGPGLSQERIQSLNAFFAQKGEKLADIQLGKGLIFVKRAVEQHGRHLSFTTPQKGRGCKITFEWREQR